MVRRILKKVSIEPPPGWTDKTMLAFSLPPSAPRTTTSSVVVTVEQTPASFDTYVMTELTNCARRGLRFQNQAERVCGGRQATTLHLVATTEFGALLQAMTFIDLGEPQAGAERHVAVVTATCPLDKAEELAPAFQRVLDSLEIAQDEGAFR